MNKLDVNNKKEIMLDNLFWYNLLSSGEDFEYIPIESLRKHAKENDKFSYDSPESWGFDEDAILSKIDLYKIPISEYYNGSVEYFNYDINSFFEMFFFIKESFPQLSNKIDSIIEDTFKKWLGDYYHKKFKKDLIIFNNVMAINNGSLAI